MITAGFKDVTVLSEKTIFKNITLIKTPGRHGYNEEIYNALGNVCGIVMISDNEMKTYIAGDTVWYEAVERTLLLHKPEFIILNAGANSIYTEQLIMGKEEVKKTHETLPDALLLATHMEGVNHWTLSRQELRDFSIEHGFSEQLYIPFDGESILLNKEDM